jgi:hypothetical protein
MRMIGAACVLSVAFSLARVTKPLGRQPKVPERGLQAPRMWQDRDRVFALERPKSDRWLFRGGVRGPGGEPVPLVALSEETGAQLVVQSADGIEDLHLLARVLMENLAREERVYVEDVVRVPARGGEGYAFFFTVADETRGRWRWCAQATASRWPSPAGPWARRPTWWTK